MVFFKGQTKVGQRPDWSPLGVSFKISDEQPRPFHMGVPPGPASLLLPPLAKSTLYLIK